MTLAIDIDKLDAAVEAAPGNTILVTKAQWRQISADVRRGHAAQRAITNIRTMALVAPGEAA